MVGYNNEPQKYYVIVPGLSQTAFTAEPTNDINPNNYHMPAYKKTTENEEESPISSFQTNKRAFLSL
jgi:hypothetical protein